MTTSNRIVSQDADPAAYQALTLGVAFMRQPSTDLVVALGSDVVKLLQGLVLNNLFQLADPGSGQLNASVNNLGRLLSLFRVLHVNDLLLLDLPEGAIDAGFLRHLKNHVITEDATFKDRSKGIEKFVIAGPNSLKLLNKIISQPPKILSQLPPFYSLAGAIKTSAEEPVEYILQRLDDLNDLPSYQIILSSNDADAVYSLLRSEGVVEVSTDMYDFVRLECMGRARWGLELNEEIIPLEGDLDPIVSYDKGCYLGQEIIARLDSRKRYAKRLTTIQMETEEVPEPGEDILFYDEKKKRKGVVGNVIYGIYSTRYKSTFVRAYLKRPAHELHAEVICNECTGRVIQVAGVPLGFTPTSLENS